LEAYRFKPVGNQQRRYERCPAVAQQVPKSAGALDPGPQSFTVTEVGNASVTATKTFEVVPVSLGKPLNVINVPSTLPQLNSTV
jgi:hypothetical protein